MSEFKKVDKMTQTAETKIAGMETKTIGEIESFFSLRFIAADVKHLSTRIELDDAGKKVATHYNFNGTVMLGEEGPEAEIAMTLVSDHRNDSFKILSKDPIQQQTIPSVEVFKNAKALDADIEARFEFVRELNRVNNGERDVPERKASRTKPLDLSGIPDPKELKETVDRLRAEQERGGNDKPSVDTEETAAPLPQNAKQTPRTNVKE